MYDFAIIGGGIVGLATGDALLQARPGARVVILEKERTVASHQTGRNSGVIHSGVYYKPGSLKAQMARDGNASMVQFCRDHGIEHDVCGKVIVATRPAELPQLETLLKRGQENGLVVEKLTSEQVREVEPNVRCLAGLRVPSTGICDYKAVCQQLVTKVREKGGDIRLGIAVRRIVSRDKHILETTDGEVEADFLINCAGLQSDRVAGMASVRPDAQIVPFRGEYFELRPERRHLVKHLIYPVPDPNFPFLGMHFTRMIDGGIHCGPNAVLARGRECYRKSEVNLRDFADILKFAGFWRLVAKHPRIGTQEIWRSLFKAASVRSLQAMIPDICADDLIPSPAGIRAQALRPDGGMVDDFLLMRGEKALHVLNAPSPAATASLEIGKTVAKQIIAG